MAKVELHHVPGRHLAPSRGRGSKLDRLDEKRGDDQSPPHGGVDRNAAAREVVATRLASPPHGGVDRNSTFGAPKRAPTSRPLTGAWIETRGQLQVMDCQRCRPLTGAWIETRCSRYMSAALVSPPHGGVDRNTVYGGGAGGASGRPLTGAWIETSRCERRCCIGMVAPSRGRGSKQ